MKQTTANKCSEQSARQHNTVNSSAYHVSCIRRQPHKILRALTIVPPFRKYHGRVSRGQQETLGEAILLHDPLMILPRARPFPNLHATINSADVSLVASSLVIFSCERRKGKGESSNVLAKSSTKIVLRGIAVSWPAHRLLGSSIFRKETSRRPARDLAAINASRDRLARGIRERIRADLRPWAHFRLNECQLG